MQLPRHGTIMGPSLHNDSYLLAQQNGSLSSGLGAAVQSVTPQINGKSPNDEFEMLIRNMAQVRCHILN